jgi:hypothetical protein
VGVRPFYSRIQSREMFVKIQGTMAARAEEAREAAAFRQTDEFEQAKTFLRRRGFRVFSALVIGGRADLTVVGERYRTRAEVIELAARHREAMDARARSS